MNRILKAVAIATFAAAIPAAHAATSAQPFNVTVTLTPTCSMTTPSDVAFTYTSFQGTAANSSGGNFSVTCTSGLGYSFSLDAATPNVAGLTYNLSVPANGNGNGAAQPLQVTGTMPANQSGTCATGPTCSGSQARTLTITF